MAAFHGGKVEIARPRLRSFDGKEQALPSWEGAMTEDWLGKWAMNQMLINVSTRKFERSMRLPEGDVPAPNGSGLSKSAASRRFVALSAARLKEWMGSDLSDLGLLVIQIDGIHMDEDMTLVAAIGVDVNGDKHPLGLVEGATENAATVQALIDNLVERGLDPAVPRLFIIDGSKALSKAIRATFGRDAAIQRCQIHKARNIMDRLPKSMHAQVRRVLRQAWEMDDADKAEKLLRNLARRLERDWEGVAASILEGLDEMLTVTKLGLPPELRRSLACTNIIENVMGTVRRVSRNVKYWRSPSMALRWAGAAMQEPILPFVLPQRCAVRSLPRPWRGPHAVCASASIISPSASSPAARQSLSKLAEMLASASIFNSLAGIAVDVISLFMALLPLVESVPRAYRLKASNAASSISTMIGTSPRLRGDRLCRPVRDIRHGRRDLALVFPAHRRVWP